jgi:hypothetical protein
MGILKTRKKPLNQKLGENRQRNIGSWKPFVGLLPVVVDWVGPCVEWGFEEGDKVDVGHGQKEHGHYADCD